MKLVKWFYPGMRVKRWLALGLAGMLMVMAGTVFITAAVWPGFSSFFSEPGFVPVNMLPVVGVFLGLTGVFLIYGGLRRAFHSVVETLGSAGNVVDMVFNRRQLQRGPKIVVIGGGTGLSVLLRGLKEYTSNLTAVVTMADDGGSSGRLRGDLGMLPPGDVRNCLVALADRESLMEKLLQYRFPAGELAGHNLGNLLLAALNNMTGCFDQAIKGLSRVLAIRGQVLPVTLEDVRLFAEMEDGEIVCGESQIPQKGKRINRVFLQPESCAPVKEALQAIKCADAVVLGPGSLYTSVLPNLLVNGMSGAVVKSKALKIYVCNVMTQPGETDGYDVAEHVKVILKHAGPVIDYVLVNSDAINDWNLARYRKEGACPVEINVDEINRLGVKLKTGHMVQEGNVVRHHPDRLARHILHLVMVHKEGNDKVIPLTFFQRSISNAKDREQVIVTGE